MFLEKLNAAVCYMTVILDIILSEIKQSLKMLKSEENKSSKWSGSS